MRGIKFRVWDKENKEMIFQSDNTTKTNSVMETQFIFDDMGPWVFTKNYLATAWNEIKSFELMQYTGLKDKNGVEIYEGDILRCWRSIGEKGDSRGEYARFLPVKYCNQWCQFVAVDKELKMQYGIWQNFDVYEVLGNIFENPELLYALP